MSNSSGHSHGYGSTGAGMSGRAIQRGVVAVSDVIIGRPESPPAGDALPRVRLYLYQMAPNAALRNADLPSRGLHGTLVKRPMRRLRAALPAFLLWQ